MHASGQRVWSVATNMTAGIFLEEDPREERTLITRAPGAIPQNETAAWRFIEETDMGSDDWAERAWESSGMFFLACQTDGTNPLLSATVRKGRCTGRHPPPHCHLHGNADHPERTGGQSHGHQTEPRNGSRDAQPSRVSTREATRTDNGPRMEDRGRWNRPRIG